MDHESDSDADMLDSLLGMEEAVELTNEGKRKLQALNDAIDETPYNIAAHLEHITLLRKYGLSDQLYAAHIRLLEKFPLPEHVWSQWLKDESTMLTAAERSSQLKLHARSVEDFLTVALWEKYVIFIEEQASAARKSEDLESQRIFDEKLLTDVYHQALEATRFHMTESDLIWNRYIDLLTEKFLDSSGSFTPQIEQVRFLYMDRLGTPHRTIESTFTKFSMFVTQNYPDSYEGIMVDANKMYKRSLQHVTDCGMYEDALAESDGGLAEYSSYLEWQTSKSVSVHPQHKELSLTLFERALEKHRLHTTFWEDKLSYSLKQAVPIDELCKYLSRAVRSCPWEASLWAHLIRNLDKKGAAIHEILGKQNLAIATGLLDDDAANVSQVFAATSAVMRNRMASSTNAEEVPDYNEFLSDAVAYIEAITRPDLSFLLHRLLIASLTRSGDVSEARSKWKSLEKTMAPYVAFWLAYFDWELHNGTVKYARNVIKSAVIKTEDDLQSVFDRAAAFELAYGTSEDYERTFLVIKKATANYARRIKAVSPTNTFQADAATTLKSEDSSSKRKAEDLPVDTDDTKRAKIAPTNGDRSIRLRENTSLIVKGLGKDVSQAELQNFFKDCGTIKALNISELSTEDSAVALIEFESTEDSLAAQTRDLKDLKGRPISIEMARNACLFVTNFPAVFDAAAISSLFSDHGHVIDVRLPSLMYDKTRRFAYVQMSSCQEAHSALQLDGRDLGSGNVLDVKISNPAVKTERAEPAREGRELFVKRISWKAKQSDVVKLFEQYGKIVSLRMPKTISKDHHDGIAFVDFTEAASAQAALELNSHLLKNMAIEVSISVPRGKLHPKVPPREPKQPEPSSGRATGPSKPEIRSKTLGVMNLADVTNEEQIRSVFAEFGSLRRVELRPEHSGAIVEYELVADAGKASLALPGKEMGGRTIVIGSYEELMKQGSSQHISGSERDHARLMPPPSLRGRPARRGRGALQIASYSRPVVSDKQTSSGDQKDNLKDATQDDSKVPRGRNQGFFRELMDKSLSSSTETPMER